MAFNLNLLHKKLPRGVIYHTVLQSIHYLVSALFMQLDDKSVIDKFEKAFAQYCGRKYGVAFPFARTAIYFILKGLDLPRGSEVILPPITIKGIVDVVLDLGLKPRYVELDNDTICFDLDALKIKISPLTKVAIITPLFGLVPNMDVMTEIFRENGVFVIEDFSQCLNGSYKKKRIGTFGNVGIYSSSSIKTLDTLGGGLVVTDDDVLFSKLRYAQASLQTPSRKFLVKKAWLNFVRNIATVQPWFTLVTFPFLQLIRKRDPESALKQTGHRDKSRLTKLPSIWFSQYTSVQANIGLANLASVSLNDSIRVENAELVKSSTRSKMFPLTTPSSINVYWQLLLLVPNSTIAQSFFASRGVDVATSSLELVCALRDYPNYEPLLEASRIYRNGIFIPCYPSQSCSDKKRVIAVLKEYFDQNS